MQSAMNNSMFQSNTFVRRHHGKLLTFLLLGFVHNAYADGTTELGIAQALQAGTTVYVDILDPSVERIRWTGLGSVSVVGPTGASQGSFASGTSITPGGAAGRYALTIGSNQSVSTAWDVAVLNQTAAGGRVFSYDWRFNAASYAQTNASNGSFYAVVPSGGASNTAVIELKLAGLAGYIYQVNANRSGVNGSTGQSLPIAGHSTTPEFPLYLKPPTLSTYASVTPALSGVSFRGGAATSVFGAPLSCNRFVSGVSSGTFSFVTDGEATYHLTCDIDGDGLYSSSSTQDVLLIGNASAGLNTVSWDGRNRAGAVIAPGNYNCRVELNAGEFHYVGRDIETSYPGMRLFEVSATGGRAGLPMFWNDASIQALDILMPNGQHSLVSSGDQGILPGLYTDPAVANVNARAWGAFAANGKGNDAFLDTYVWLSQAVSLPISLVAMDNTTDLDGDGLSDFSEYCTYGTDPANPDTDGNGVPDGTQYKGGTTSGATGGLESNARMSLGIARRSVASHRKALAPRSLTLRHSLGTQTEMDVQYTEAPASYLGSPELAALLPERGPRGAAGKPASPVDLPEITNAKAVSARDYVGADGTLLGTVMLIETVGEVYEHSKAVCDRAHGAQLTDVARGAGNAGYLRAETVQNEARDRSISFMLYEEKNDSGVSYSGTARWLVADYPKPKAGQRIIAAQVWSRHAGDEEALVAGLLENIGKRGEFVWSHESIPSAGPAADRATIPGVYASRAHVLGQALTLDVRNVIQLNASASARLRLEDGSFKDVPLAALSSQEVQHHSFSLPPFLDAMVDISLAGKVVDKVWLSDGTWIPMAERLAGNLSPSGFSNLSCAVPDTEYARAKQQYGIKDGSIRLAGCGAFESQGAQRSGVARTLSGPGLDLAGFHGVLFRAKANAPFKACLESTAAKAAACAPLAASAEPQWYYVKSSDFVPTQAGSAPLKSVSLVNFETLGALEVGGLTFSHDAPEAAGNDPAALEASAGCRTAAKGEPQLLAALLLVSLAAMYRASRQKRKSL
jgi:hypothetical protein